MRVSSGKKRNGKRRTMTKTVDTEREADLCIAKLAVEMAFWSSADLTGNQTPLRFFRDGAAVLGQYRFDWQSNYNRRGQSATTERREAWKP